MMKIEQLHQITAASLEKYLLFLDWVRVYDFPNRNMMVFKKNERTIAMPSSERLDDFYVSLPNIIDILADFYNKTTREVVKEITTSYHDLLEFRIKSKISEEGALPLGYATNCIEGLKELILYSACAEQSKEPVCMKCTNNAKNVLNNFRLAQTEVGSFIINIDIKVAEEEEQYVLENFEPKSSFEHDVVKRIGKAIQQIDDVTKEELKLDEMLPTAYESGVTANICDALMKLKPENVDAEIETKIRYASALSKCPGCVETVQIKNNHFYTMNEIAERYRKVENTTRVTIHGSIKTLDKVPIGQHRYKRTISVLAFVAEGKERIVKVELGEDDHRMACNAFRDEREVEIIGELDMSKKKWEMRQIENFTII